MDGKPVILVPTLWKVLVVNLRGMWPEGRTKFHEGGVGLGDVWRVSTLDSLNDGTPFSHVLIQGLQSLVPFHKLTQWLCYSLLQVFKYANVIVEGEQLLTALPEYRNGIYGLSLSNSRRSSRRHGAVDFESRLSRKRFSCLSSECPHPGTTGR